MRVLVAFSLMLSFGAGCAGSADMAAAPNGFGGSSVGGQPTAGNQATSIEFESIGDLAART
ncbi:MAG: hypothetical protein ABUL60_21005, partial [Myxococcales bacterium]